MHVGTDEVLYAQITAFADKLRLSGVELEHVEYKKLWHVAHLQASILREAAQAVQHMARTWGARSGQRRRAQRHRLRSPSQRPATSPDGTPLRTSPIMSARSAVVSSPATTENDLRALSSSTPLA